MGIQEHISQERLLDNIFDEALGNIWKDDEEITQQSIWENNTPPVPIKEFVESPKYLGLAGKIYPAIMYSLENIERPEIREADLMFGKGSGKSTILQIFMAYSVYELLCLKNPQQYFELIPDTPLTVLLVSVSENQAKRVGFAGTKSLIEHSPWFKGRYEPFSSEIRFEKQINLYSGHSGASSWLGYNSVRAAMDEVEYMQDSNNRSVAKELYRALKGSLTTRFPGKYKLLCVSSPKEEYSFLNQRFKMVKDNGQKMILPEGIDVSKRRSE